MYTLRTNNNNEHHFEREERARSVDKGKQNQESSSENELHVGNARQVYYKERDNSFKRQGV